METVYDWITIVIFSGLAVRYLARSADPEGVDDQLWPYALATAGCAAANWFGNHRHDLAAIGLILSNLGFIYYRLIRGETPPAGR